MCFCFFFTLYIFVIIIILLIIYYSFWYIYSYLSISCTPGARLFWPLDRHPLLSLGVDPSIALDSLTREPHHYILSGCSKGGFVALIV